MFVTRIHQDWATEATSYIVRGKQRTFFNITRDIYIVALKIFVTLSLGLFYSIFLLFYTNAKLDSGRRFPTNASLDFATVRVN